MFFLPHSLRLTLRLPRIKPTSCCRLLGYGFGNVQVTSIELCFLSTYFNQVVKGTIGDYLRKKVPVTVLSFQRENRICVSGHSSKSY